MKKFEYKTRTYATPACEGMEDTMKKLGKEGWELVNVCPISGGLITAFFKKEIL